MIIAACGSEDTLPKVGLAPYAIQHPEFPCQDFIRIINSHPNDVSISFLWKTFGDDEMCLSEVLNLPTVDSFLIFGMNAVCQRNGNCDSFETLSGISVSKEEDLLTKREGWFVDKITNHFKAVEEFVRKFSNNKCYLAPELEGNISDEAFLILKEIIEPIVPSCEIVHNPVSNSTNLARQLTEFHHADVRPPCFYSNDGISVYYDDLDSNWSPLYLSIDDLKNEFNNASSCENRYLWHHHFNCLSNNFVPPRQRNCNRPEIAIITDRFFNLVNEST